MPTDWIEREPNALADQIETFVNALDTAEKRTAASVTTAQLSALSARATALRARTTAKAKSAAQYKIEVKAESDAAALAEAELRTVGMQAQNAATMTDALRLAAGLTVRKRTAKGYAEIPTVEDLVALPRAGGHTFLDWSGPTGGGVAYDVQARRKPDAPWESLGFTMKTAYTHDDAGAGVRHEYRIVPRRGDREGEPSNTVTVY